MRHPQGLPELLMDSRVRHGNDRAGERGESPAKAFEINALISPDKPEDD